MTKPKRKATTWNLREIRQAFFKQVTGVCDSEIERVFVAELRRLARSRKPKKRGMK